MITTESVNSMIHRLWWEIHCEFVRQGIEQWDKEQISGCFPTWINEYCAYRWRQIASNN